MEFQSFGNARKRQALSRAFRLSLRNVPEISFDVLRDRRSLIDLDDISVTDQERDRQTQIAVAIEQVAIKNVVDCGHVLRSTQNGNGEMTVANERLRRFNFFRIIHVHRYQLLDLDWPTACKFG